MKKSHIDWCPMIPDHWEEKRVKDIASLQSGESITAMDIADDGEYPVYGGNGLRGYTKTYTNDGDYVLIGRQGALCGNINYAHGKFFATEHAVVVYTKKDENTYWLGETLRAANLNRLSMTAAQPGLAVSAISLQFIPYPPKEERTRIAQFIKEKTSDISRQVSLLTRKRDAYLRLKKSIINHAVTKGLNPNAKMKDSGIEWIGDVPEEWEVKRLKDCITLIKGRTPNELTLEPIDLPYLSMDYLREREGKDTMYPKNSSGLLKIGDNEIIVLWDGANAGEFIYSKKGYLGSTMAIIQCNNHIVAKNYMYYLLKGIEYDSKYFANGTTIPHFDSTTIMTRQQALPPLPEQRSIATYLDDKCSKIDAIVANLNKQISRYGDLKRSLIDEVITGKRTV